MKYRSGEEIRKGDRVLYHAEPGEVEFVVEKFVGGPAMDWHMNEEGPGVMVFEPKFFGRVCISDTENDEDLEFVSTG